MLVLDGETTPIWSPKSTCRRRETYLDTLTTMQLSWLLSGLVHEQVRQPSGRVTNFARWRPMRCGTASSPQSSLMTHAGPGAPMAGPGPLACAELRRPDLRRSSAGLLAPSCSTTRCPASRQAPRRPADRVAGPARPVVVALQRRRQGRSPRNSPSIPSTSTAWRQWR